MKLTKIFGIVLFLHIGVISVLLIHPGCKSSQTGSPSEIGPGTTAIGPSTGPEGAYVAEGVRLMDPAFNDGFTVEEPFEAPQVTQADGPPRFPPTRPTWNLAPASAAIPKGEMETSTYTIKRGDSLWLIAKRANISLGELLELNQGLDKNGILRIGQQIKIPGFSNRSNIPSPSTLSAGVVPTSVHTEGKLYTVKKGDTLWDIARKNGTSVRAIKVLNELGSGAIRPGQKLLLPSKGASTAAKPPESGSQVEVSTGKSSITDSGGLHTVKPGETASTIAQKYGMTTEELIRINAIRDPRSLQIGQRLKLSKQTPPLPAPAPTVQEPVADFIPFEGASSDVVIIDGDTDDGETEDSDSLGEIPIIEVETEDN